MNISTPLPIAIGVLIVACSNPTTPVTSPPLARSEPFREAAAAPDANDGRQGRIVVDPALAKLCDIPTAYFSFDSARLSPSAATALDKLAECFTTGAAKHRSMRLVGHCDPRGELTYNFALGQLRAGTVEDHILARGVERSRVESSSRGELDAVGVDETSWALDRSVAISMTDDEGTE